MNDFPKFCLALIKFKADEMYDLTPFKVSLSSIWFKCPFKTEIFVCTSRLNTAVSHSCDFSCNFSSAVDTVVAVHCKMIIIAIKQYVA